jgi:glycerophosphoryl diester phosphodiesterase
VLIQANAQPQKAVIAHRGAPGYLPEHTFASKVMAYAMGANYLEQDVVLTKDDQAIILHDIYLDAVTDIVQCFPNRARSDGLHYAIDFTLKEIRSLKVHERIDLRSKRALYPNRFPPDHAIFRIHTLAEEIELIQGLNQHMDGEVGLYVEIKNPQWHQKEGKDITKIVLGVLNQYGYQTQKDRIVIQCFDVAALKRLKFNLKTQIPLVQMLGDNSWWPNSSVDYNYLRTPKGLEEISTYAVGVGPWIYHIYLGKDKYQNPLFTSLVRDAHSKGLIVHPYIFNKDQLPKGIKSFNELLNVFYFQLGVDGVFTDFPDLVIQFLKNISQ